MSKVKILSYEFDEKKTEEIEKLLGIKKPVEFGAALAHHHLAWIEKAVLDWRKEYYPSKNDKKSKRKYRKNSF